MLKMLEITASSELGYSEAVRGAIEKLTAAGEKIHFFQVLEQRGSVRDGKLREFQAIMKVAVEPR